MKNKARIIFNGVEKVVEVSEEFVNLNNISNEAAGLAMEKSPFLNPPEEYANTPYIELPNHVAKEVFSETEFDKKAEILYNQFGEKIIELIEKEFSVKVNHDLFYREEFDTSESDIENGILIHIEADDK